MTPHITCMDRENENFDQEGLDFTADLITLTDEDGVDHTFELVDTLDRDGESYVALIAQYDDPSEALEDDGDLVIMKIVSEDGQDEVLELIEDDDEFEEISEIFLERLSDLYDFDESDDE